MKKIVMFFMVIFLILQCLLITSVAENANEESKPKEFIDIPTNKAYGFGIYEDILIRYEMEAVYLTNLTTNEKKTLKMWSNPGGFYLADVYGNYIAYSFRNSSRNNDNIYLYNYLTNVDIQITNDIYIKENLQIHGNFIIWESVDEEVEKHTYWYYNIKENITVEIDVDINLKDDTRLNLEMYLFNENIVYFFRNNIENNYYIKTYDLLANKSNIIYKTNNQILNLIMNDAYVIWNEELNYTSNKLMAYDLTLKLTQDLDVHDIRESKFVYPIYIFKDKIAYYRLEENPLTKDLFYKVYLFDLNKRSEYIITNHNGSQTLNIFDYNMIVFRVTSDHSEKGYYLYDITIDSDGDGSEDYFDDDDDNDGYIDDYEIKSGTIIWDDESLPNDIDLDLIPNILDDDIDGDNFNNTIDEFPENPDEWIDADNDNLGDYLEDPYPNDHDNDGKIDNQEDPKDNNKQLSENMSMHLLLIIIIIIIFLVSIIAYKFSKKDETDKKRQTLEVPNQPLYPQEVKVRGQTMAYGTTTGPNQGQFNTQQPQLPQQPAQPTQDQTNIPQPPQIYNQPPYIPSEIPSSQKLVGYSFITLGLLVAIVIPIAIIIRGGLGETRGFTMIIAIIAPIVLIGHGYRIISAKWPVNLLSWELERKGQ